MGELLKVAERAAATDAKVLITGESGVGKDVLARYIHANSARRQSAFVAVNCAGVPETLLESELFGHVKGSFTGAFRDRVGTLRQAHRGTLFLDEVGEMSLRMQALLLRFLESGDIQAVGSDVAPTAVDVRVLAATNRNLTDLVASGKFREDLLYRLCVVHLQIPPLRHRVEDIRPLGQHFLTHQNRQVELKDEAWRALERYKWPGNVRELLNVMGQVVWLSPTTGEPIGVEHLPPAVQSSNQSILPPRERRRQVADDLYRALAEDGYSFWEHIRELFLNRDITRHDIRELVRRGLSVTHGNYRALLPLFGMPVTDYKRFINFLTTHDCRPDYREFRRGSGDDDLRAIRVIMPPLPPLPSANQEGQTEGKNGLKKRAS
jgi:transcriptional regulator with PAS, ATPase and Fis domain